MRCGTTGTLVALTISAGPANGRDQSVGVWRKPGVWRGGLFVPDINTTLSRAISVPDPNRIEGKGCLLGHVGCKSQNRRRAGE